MNEQGRYILALVILILFSGLFSAIETAYSCASQIKLKNMANDHNAEAGVVIEVLNDFDRFLTTILIANNIVNIAAATIGTLLFTSFLGEAEGSTVSTIVITILVLIFGEVTPKSIAKRIPEKMAVHTVQFVQFLEVILIPLVVVFKGIG